jgi:Tol biopolymer transport system component
LKTHLIGVGWARWLPRGRHLAVQPQDGLGSLRIATPSGRTVGKFSAVSEYSSSPDGRRIVYSELGRVIRVAGIDGKNRHRLAGGDHPSWSSRNWIAFSAMGYCGRQRVERIFVVRPNGKRRHVLSRCSAPG